MKIGSCALYPWAVGTLAPGHAWGPEAGRGPPSGLSARAQPALPPAFPCSLRHPRPSLPAVRCCLVFPHHFHHGVLCISALSEDPEAQFCVSLHQFPHRALCLPGLVAAHPGDSESADEAQPPLSSPYSGLTTSWASASFCSWWLVPSASSKK